MFWQSRLNVGTKAEMPKHALGAPPCSTSKMSSGTVDFVQNSNVEKYSEEAEIRGSDKNRLSNFETKPVIDRSTTAGADPLSDAVIPGAISRAGDKRHNDAVDMSVSNVGQHGVPQGAAVPPPDSCPPKRARRRKMTREEMEVPDDGYRWLQYGKKPLLDTRYSRFYYKCASKKDGCPAKKTVDCCSGDSSFMRVSYEGRHTHPAPSQTAREVFIYRTTRAGAPHPGGLEDIQHGSTVMQGQSQAHPQSSSSPVQDTGPSASSAADGTAAGGSTTSGSFALGQKTTTRIIETVCVGGTMAPGMGGAMMGGFPWGAESIESPRWAGHGHELVAYSKGHSSTTPGMGRSASLNDMEALLGATVGGGPASSMLTSRGSVGNFVTAGLITATSSPAAFVEMNPTPPVQSYVKYQGHHHDAGFAPPQGGVGGAGHGGPIGPSFVGDGKGAYAGHNHDAVGCIGVPSGSANCSSMPPVGGCMHAFTAGGHRYGMEITGMLDNRHLDASHDGNLAAFADQLFNSMPDSNWDPYPSLTSKTIEEEEEGGEVDYEGPVPSCSGNASAAGSGQGPTPVKMDMDSTVGGDVVSHNLPLGTSTHVDGLIGADGDSSLNLEASVGGGAPMEVSPFSNDRYPTGGMVGHIPGAALLGVGGDAFEFGDIFGGSTHYHPSGGDFNVCDGYGGHGGGSDTGYTYGDDLYLHMGASGFGFDATEGGDLDGLGEAAAFFPHDDFSSYGHFPGVTDPFWRGFHHH